MNIPFFECSDRVLNKAYRLAVACVTANTVPIKAGALQSESPCVMAGMDYDTPWTRDSAINVMNAIAYLDPEISHNMLLSVVAESDGRAYVGDQYWDCVIWGLAARKLYDFTGDTVFLRYALAVMKNTLRKLENEEYDAEIGLYRGPAVYGDGVAAYPDRYHIESFDSAIWKWQDFHPEARAPVGYGLPMMALSTNCLYIAAYRAVGEMEQLIGEPGTEWYEKAEKLVSAVRRCFVSDNAVGWDYLFGESDAQEGLGLAFAILFGVADAAEATRIADNAFVTEYGIPCVWPTFPRYADKGFGRHSGTIWPQVQGFWAKAMLSIGRRDKFEKELFALVANASRDLQFTEIYHPLTGLPYGGIQESEAFGDYILWKSCDYQTWSATAFLSMVYEGIFGLSVRNCVPTADPVLPSGVTYARLTGVTIAGKKYDFSI